MWEDLKSMKRQIIGGLSGMLIAMIIALIVPGDNFYLSAILGGVFTLGGAMIGQYLDNIKELEDRNQRWR